LQISAKKGARKTRIYYRCNFCEIHVTSVGSFI